MNKINKTMDTLSQWQPTAGSIGSDLMYNQGAGSSSTAVGTQAADLAAPANSGIEGQGTVPAKVSGGG